MTTAYRILLALVIASALAIPVSAQVATGTPAFGSYSGGPDVINLANLNAHIDVPMVNKPGRGMAFTYDMVNDSSVWYPVGVSGSKTWQYVPNWNWAGQTQITTGYATYSHTVSGCNLGTTRDPENVYYNIYTFINYYDQFGRSHSLGNAEVSDDNYGCPNDHLPISVTTTLQDGSGLKFYLFCAPSVTVYPPTGGVLTPPLLAGAGAGTAIDRNGNEISVSGGVFTDTLGTTALTVAGSGTPSSPMTFSYAAPSGASAAYTMKYTAYTVQTKFNCSGISEYGPISNNLVSEIDLPDIAVNTSDKYTFTYEVTPGDAHTPHYVTGRIASVTLPTGGTISYVYSGGGSGVNGISCGDGSGAMIARTTPDGIWTYSQVKGTAAASTTTVTDPQGNQTVIQFQGIYETQRQAYQGTTSGTLLETVNTCYNASSSPCTATVIAAPITQRNVIGILPGASNLESEHIYKYNSNGSLTEQDDYDYGSGAPGALLKKTAITLAALVNLSAFRQQVTVTNGTGTIVSQTIYNYDQTSAVVTSGTPQHVSPSGARGNLTSVNNYTQGSTYLTKTMTYFDTGNVQTVTDINGAQTTYTYGACGNGFPTTVAEPLSLSRSMTWNCTGGVQLTAKDENSQVTSITYSDPYFWRPASKSDQESNITSLYYGADPMWIAQELFFNGNQSLTDTNVGYDGLGRLIVTNHAQTPSQTAYDQVVQSYDSNGRPWKTSAPCVTTGAWTCPTTAQTTTYDPLNRISQITDAGGGTLTKSYTQNDVLVTRGPAPTGENTKRRQLEYDGLGRLTSVCEITAGTSAWPGGTCAQNTTQTGYWTKYTYDPLGHLE